MDTNRIVKIEELTIGDVILIPRNSNLVIAKVLREPAKSLKNYRWRPAVQRWKPIKCSVNASVAMVPYGYNSKKEKLIYNTGQYIEMFLNLNFKDIYLIERNSYER